MDAHTRSLTPAEQELIDGGFARVYRGRLIPIMRGAEGDGDAGDGGDAGSAGTGGDGGAGDGGGAARTFTQDELDRIVRDRLARQKAQFGDYDELKERAARLQEIEDAQKSELQKAQDRLAALEQQAATERQQRLDALYESAVIAEAAKKNVADPKDAVRLIDRSAVQFGDDGTPTNVADVVASLLVEKPYLVGAGGHGSGADQGARGGSVEGQITREQLASMKPEEIVAAQAAGKLNHLLAGS